MLILVTGGTKNGKSSIAQKMICSLATCDNRLYLATMKPCDDEDAERILKHKKDRAGLSFKTFECACDISSCEKKIFELCSRPSLLLDSLTSLLSNEMFRDGKIVHRAGEKILLEIKNLSKALDNLVLVSDSIFSDAIQYEELTEEYRRELAFLENEIGCFADVVIKMECGQPFFVKGKKLFMDVLKDCLPPEKKDEKNIFVYGGSFQGKSDFAKKTFELEKKEIYSCTRDSLPDFSYKCLCHLENYVWYSLKSREPVDFAKLLGKILIMDDITCGIVPMEPFERKWREECGLFSQRIASCSKVIRIVCGKAFEL